MNPFNTKVRTQITEAIKKALKLDKLTPKEVDCFQHVESKRRCLKGTAAILVATPLISSGLFSYGLIAEELGSEYPNKDNSEQTFGATNYTPAQGPTATQIVYGTELFSDTVYSESVIPPDTTYLHCTIDSSARAIRMQSDLTSSNPIESTFSDNGHAFALNDFVQLEEVSTTDTQSTWDLVHYQHPIGAVTNGARTEGLERIVIKSGITVDAPTSDGPSTIRLFSSIAGANNVGVVNDNGDLEFTARCLLYVELNQGKSDGYLIYGTVTSTAPSDTLTITPDTIGEYQWTIKNASSMYINTGYSSVRHFVNSGYTSSGVFEEKTSYQHIVFNEGNGAHILTMTPEGYLSSSKVFYPNNASDAPVVHIDWNSSENRVLRTVVYGNQTTNDKDGNTYLVTQSYEFSKVDSSKSVSAGFPTTCTYTEFKDDNDHAKNKPQSYAPNVSGEIYCAWNWVWKDVNSIHDLYRYTDSEGNVYYVKLLEMTNAAMPAIVVLKHIDGNGHWYHKASYPLRLPEPITGNGDIKKISSCFSKFGGMRYFILDENKNLYLARQQRASSSDTPYGKPIYGPYDETGAVRNFESNPISYVKNTPYDWHYIEGNCYKSSTDEDITIPIQLVLSTLMAFDTNTSTNSSSTLDGTAQAVCLASGCIVDITTPRRTYHDSEYISSVMMTDSTADSTTFGATDTNTYGLYRSINTLLERKWHSHEIASQIEYDPTLDQATGDYYHLTLSPADSDGNIASLSDTANQDLMLEIRADSDCTVTDTVSNYCHNINRYASFMAQVDPATKQANIVLKASTFGQNIYARLVNSKQFEASSTDIGLIAAADDAITYPWQVINITEQAQYRMGNTSDTTVQTNDSNPTPFMDTNVYVTGASIANSKSTVSSDSTSTGPDYSTKGSFKKTSDGMQPTATFLNQSGTNMLIIPGVTRQTLYPDASSDTLNPLFCLTSSSSTQTTASNTTSFTYSSGTVTNNPGGLSAVATSKENTFGTSFSKVCHGVSDALHHLQHLSESAYSDLSNGVQIAINVSASDMVKIDKSIMKAVNGLDQDLQETIDSIEQFASIVVEVLKTIIKASFMYQFIELIIWLISLFRYFEDIKSLKNSLATEFSTLINTPPSAISSGMSAVNNTFSNYFGSANQTSTNSLFTSSTISSDIASIVSAQATTNKASQNISNNPFLNYLLHPIMKKTNSSSMSDDFGVPDVSISDISDIEDDLANMISNILANLTDTQSEEMLSLLVLLANVSNSPSSVEKVFTDNISNLTSAYTEDIVEPILEILTKVSLSSKSGSNNGGYDTSFITSMISQDLFTIKLGLIGDIFALFGIGSGDHDNLTVSGTDLIFWPIALATWVTLYVDTGKSYSSLSDITGDSAEEGFGATSANKATIAFDSVSALYCYMHGLVWTAKQLSGDSNTSSNPIYLLDNILTSSIAAIQFVIKLQTEDTEPLSTSSALFYLGMTLFSMFKGALQLNGTSLPPQVVAFIITTLALENMVGQMYAGSESEINDPNWTEGAEEIVQAIFTSIGKYTNFAWVCADDPTEYLAPASALMQVPMVGFSMGLAYYLAEND